MAKEKTLRRKDMLLDNETGASCESGESAREWLRTFPPWTSLLFPSKSTGLGWAGAARVSFSFLLHSLPGRSCREMTFNLLRACAELCLFTMIELMTTNYFLVSSFTIARRLGRVATRLIRNDGFSSDFTWRLSREQLYEFRALFLLIDSIFFFVLLGIIDKYS